MTLYTLAIRRPVLAIVMSITVVLFGAIAATRLGVREFPSVDPPVINVSVNYRGANADVIESQVTEPLEDAVNGIDGIRTITSVSREGRSSITVEFDLGSDLERAVNDVRDKVFGALDNLPPDVEPPEVSKSDADAQPIIQATLGSKQRNLLELTRLADELFVERLQTIPGVARVDVWGERTYAMRLWIDPGKLAAYRLSLLDVRDAVERENVELPSGRIEGQDVELPVRTLSRLNSPEEFNRLVIKQDQGRVVRFSDVGYAELGPRNQRTVLKREGVPMTGVTVRPQPGANYIDIANEFYRRVERIRRDLPADVEVGYSFDNTRFIRRSISEVRETIFLALALVIAIIFLFLRDWRTTLVPVLAIPVSLIGSFFVMYLAGFSINVLTLLAIVLAIGMVVDDAIIVLENIYAKIEAGANPLQAGVAGTREIFFAVIATTVALVGVFLPILFMGGLAGRLFREFGVTLAGAIVISAFVALTLTPMLSARFLKKRAVEPRFYRLTEPWFERLAAGYRSTLGAFLRRRWLAFPIIAASVAVGLLAYLALPKELAPVEDRGFIRMNARGPEGATFEYMERVTDELTALVAEAVPERAALVTVTSPSFGSAAANSSFVRLSLVERKERERSQQEIAAVLEQRARAVSGARTSVSQEPTIQVGQRRGLPVEFVLQAPSIEALREVVPRFLAEAQADPTFTFVDVDLKFEKPELRVEIDRARAQDLGVSALAIGQTLQLALAEQRLGFFLMDGKQYEVIGQVTRGFRDETFDLKNLYVRAPGGPPVQLDKLVSVREEARPPQLYRFDRYVSATVSAALASGKTVGDGIEAMRAIATRVLDESFRTALSGQARDFAESASSLWFVFGLAVVLIYLVLAAQFESFLDPIVVLIITLLLAGPGALAALWLTGQTFNIFSQIGLIMLIGLVTKNGILIVEFANQRKAQGSSVKEATLDASAARLRPILMTSLSTILGILPIALALGAGSEGRTPMGIAVVGGLTVGTFLTLYVVPAVYSYLTSEKAQTGLAFLEEGAASEAGRPEGGRPAVANGEAA
jgi:multidrug efflux pump